MKATTARAEHPIDTLDPLSTYRWLTASLMPRPIAWVSTVDADGVDNVAPHSFTTVASTEPAVICFVSMTTKDTLANIRATGEFVVNLGTERLVPVMNDTATPFPAGVSEFDEAQIEREPSAVVRPPRVAGAPVALECKFLGEHNVGNGYMVFGEVVHIAALHTVLAEDGLPDARLVAPVTRLGRSEWGTLGEVLHVDRLTLEQWRSGLRTGG